MSMPSVPGYQLLRFLGGGPSFEVWEARPDDDVVPVAIKLPRPEALEKSSTLMLLRREARAGVCVRHPRLIKVLRHHLTEPPYFVVLELVPGESLRNRLRRLGRMSVRLAAWAVRQAAEGLAALHRAGLVHADVKPGNILLDRRGETKLIDLGFAHKPGENRELLKSGYVMGTPAYLAPELCKPPPREGPPADLFALGVTLFECLTGQLPYPKAATAEVAMEHRRDDAPADLTDVPGRWPDRIVELTRSLLASNPRNRPNAARVVRELVQIEIDCIHSAALR